MISNGHDWLVVQDMNIDGNGRITQMIRCKCNKCACWGVYYNPPTGISRVRDTDMEMYCGSGNLMRLLK